MTAENKNIPPIATITPSRELDLAGPQKIKITDAEALLRPCDTVGAMKSL